VVVTRFVSPSGRTQPTAGDGGIVPYIALWTGEEPLGRVRTRFRRSGGRLLPVELGFTAGAAAERDARGVLWNHTALRPGAGRPRFGKVHPMRQRRAMRGLLCQVCAGPADTTEAGTLWLLTDDQADWPDWPNRMGNDEPPICRPCARLALAGCPRLGRGHTAVRARSTVAGVTGVLYRPGDPSGQETAVPVAERVVLTHGDHRLPWLLASGLVRQLFDARVEELD
jgi:hypothetical protein